MYFDFRAESPAREDAAAPLASLKRRRAALWTIWQTLRRLEDDERGVAIVTLRSILAGRDYRARLGRAMTGDEVLTLVTDGLVTIGAHTVTHPVLSELGAAACHREITESKLACETLIGAPVGAFAYPFGDFDTEAREAVMAAGFTLACSAQRGPAITTSDVFGLPRIYVPNLDGDAFEQTIRSASAAF